MGWTPLHHVGLKAHTETAEVLIKLGADVNAKDKHGLLPLHVMLACLEHRRSALGLSKEDWNRLCFDSCKLCLRLDFIGWLASNGGNIYAENSKGRTPLSLARDPELKADMVFLTRRPLLLFFETVCEADDLKHSDALKRVADNYDLGRHIISLL